MLEEKDYTISELAAIIGGSSDRQAIKRKLDRRHILYSIQGRGSYATFKIEKIPSPFQEFCMDVLKFSKNTDFEKLCNFYYYCLNDELFMAKPDEEKAMLLEDKGKHISRQTIAGYERKHYLMYIFILKVIQSLFTTLRVMAIIELLNMKNILKHGMIIGSGKNRRKKNLEICVMSALESN